MEKPVKQAKSLTYFIVLDIVILVISILIPLMLVSVNQTESCLHHLEEDNGVL